MIREIVPYNQSYEQISFSIYSILKKYRQAVLFLNGPLGAGKTTFTRSLLSRYGCNNVTSASYSLISSFTSDRNIVHCDFYRHFDNEDFMDLEILPLLGDFYLLIIEWGFPHKLFIEAKHFALDISINENGSRLLAFSSVCCKIDC